MAGRKLQPEIRLHQVPRNALAKSIKQTKTGLCKWITLICGQAIPITGLFEIFLEAAAAGLVILSQSELRIGIALGGTFTQTGATGRGAVLRTNHR